jgi:hypothetical protein
MTLLRTTARGAIGGAVVGAVLAPLWIMVCDGVNRDPVQGVFIDFGWWGPPIGHRIFSDWIGVLLTVAVYTVFTCAALGAVICFLKCAATTGGGRLQVSARGAIRGAAFGALLAPVWTVISYCGLDNIPVSYDSFWFGRFGPTIGSTSFSEWLAMSLAVAVYTVPACAVLGTVVCFLWHAAKRGTAKIEQET